MGPHAVTIPGSPSPGAPDIQAERDRLRLLLDITNMIVSRPELADLSQALSGCIGRAIPHEYASVSLYEPDGDGASRTFLVVLDGGRRPDMEGRVFAISAEASEHFGAGRPMTYDIDRLGLNN